MSHFYACTPSTSTIIKLGNLENIVFIGVLEENSTDW